MNCRPHPYQGCALPTELHEHIQIFTFPRQLPLERAAGIEPASSAWKAEVLPLNYARKSKNKALNSYCFKFASTFISLRLIGGAGGWIRTTEAFASDLQSDPFGHSGTPAQKRCIFRPYTATVNHLPWQYFKKWPKSGILRKLQWVEILKSI